MGGAVGRQETPADPTVNNFVAANAARDSDGHDSSSALSLNRFSRPGGPGLLTTSRFNDFELMDRPVGRDWTL